MGPFCQVTSLKPEHHQPEHQCTCESSATTKNHTSTKHLHHLQGAKWNKADFGRFWSTLPGSTSTDVRCVLSLSVILGRLWGGNTMQPVRASLPHLSANCLRTSARTKFSVISVEVTEATSSAKQRPRNDETQTYPKPTSRQRGEDKMLQNNTISM